MVSGQDLILPFSPCLVQRIHLFLLRQFIHDPVYQVLHIPLKIPVYFFPARVLQTFCQAHHHFFNLRTRHRAAAQCIHHLPHRIRSAFFQVCAGLVLLFIDMSEVLPEDIVGQLRAHGLDGPFCQVSVIVFCGIDHQVYMGMVPLVVECGIPAQVGAVDLHVFAEHGPLGAQQRHPLCGAVIAQPCGILPPQGDDVGPDRAFVCGRFLLHLF